MIQCDIVPYEQHHVSRVKEFNRRLELGGSRFRFPEGPQETWLPQGGDKFLFQDLFLAVDRESVVRGGYALKHQMFKIHSKLADVGMCQYPISEAVIDRKFSFVSALLFRDVLRRQPLLYALGIGGSDEPYARSLTAMGWKLYPVPFFFMILQTNRFLRNIEYLRTTPLKEAVLDFLAFSKVLEPLVGATHKGLALASISVPSLSSEIVTEFGSWADDIWRSASESFSLAAVRDSVTLNTEYPANEPFIRLQFSRRGESIGWAVLLATQMRSHDYFGSMHLGTIVDCLATPGNEIGVITGSLSHLKSLDVDLVVSNQNHGSWRSALKRTGFLQGPSNFFFGVSKSLEAELGNVSKHLPLMHLNRGDGNGPIHL